MESVVAALLTIVLVTAIWSDVRSSRIPNWLTFPAMGVALLVHACLAGMSGALFSLAGLGTGFGLFILMHLSGGLGAGDVKLMAAIGAMVGPYGALLCGLLAMVVGGFYALGAMCYQWGFAGAGRKLAVATYGALLTGGKVGENELQLRFRLRYGLAIGGGTVLFLLGLHPFGE